MKRNLILFSVLMILMLFLVAACGSESKEVIVPTQTMPVPAESAPTEAPVQETLIIPDTTETAETAPAEPVSAPAIGQVKELTVTGSNFKWELTGPSVKKGDTVKLTIKVAEGGHGFSLPAFNVRSQELREGKEQVVEFVADKSGSFEYFCNVPCGSGHRQMRGTLVVEE